MGTEEKPLKPQLVTKKSTRKRVEKQAPIISAVPETPPVKANPVPTGEPDHSLVPVARKRNLPPDEGIAFWNSVPERERDKWFMAYLYRDLPVCDSLQPLTADELRKIEKNKRLAPEVNCGKLSEPLANDTWLQTVKDRWGAGKYHLRINDQHPSVRSTVVEIQIDAGREWNTNPPVLNIEEVVLSAPENEPYLRWARLRGIKFPGDPGTEDPTTPFDNEEDMANVAAVEKLTDALVDATRNRPQAVPAPAPAAPDRSNEILADAALKGQQILLDSIKAQGKAQDPMEFHKAVTEAAKAMVPAPTAPSNNSELLTMMQLMMTQQRESNERMLAQLEKRLESAERAREAAETRAQAVLHPPAPTVSPTVANPVKDAIDLIKGLNSLKETAGSLLGDAVTDADTPWWGRVLSKVADAAPGMLYNASVIRTGQGNPVPPPDLEPELVAKETQPETPGLTEPAQEEALNEKRIANELHAPLIDALNKGRRGFEFAAGMIMMPKILGFPGSVVYEMAISQGESGLMNILKQDPDLWAKLVRIPTQFQNFLTEFMNRKVAYELVEQAKNPAPAEPVKPNGQGGGRVVIGADGKRIQTVHAGPVVDVPSA